MITAEQANQLLANQIIYKVSLNKYFQREVIEIKVISVSEKLIMLFHRENYRTYKDNLHDYFLSKDDAENHIKQLGQENGK